MNTTLEAVVETGTHRLGFDLRNECSFRSPRGRHVNSISGLVAATYTPFDEDGRVHLNAIPKMIEHLAADGVAGLFTCGSTGEGMSLATEERCRRDRCSMNGRFAWIAATAILLGSASTPANCCGAAPPEDAPLTRQLEFGRLPALPDEFGFGGPIGGVHNGIAFIVGGANFPAGPPWPIDGKPAGKKVWSDRMFFLRPDATAFEEGPRLPRPLAYAPGVSTDDGLYVLGGESYSEARGNFDTAEVLRIVADPDTGITAIERNALPPLPKPCSYHAAARIGSTIFVAASHPRDERSATLDKASFWSLDLSAEKPKWSTLPPWPGPPRHKMSLAVARGPRGTATERVYLMSGSTWFRNADGEDDLAQYRYFDDAFAFDPTRNEWTKLANLPSVPETRSINTSGYRFDEKGRGWIKTDRDETVGGATSRFDDQPRPAAAASAIGDGDHVLVVSGSTGRYVTMAVRDRPPFPSEVLAYSIDSNTWSVAGRIPTPVVTTTLFEWNGRFVVVSGEVRPGVRTPAVQTMRSVPARD